MSTAHLVPPDIATSYEVHEWRNAVGVLSTACPNEWSDNQAALRAFRLHRSEILTAGGSRSSIVERLERPLKDAGWVEKHFATAIVVDGEQRDSPTHSVDCFKGRVA
ncbi:MAG: restriction endonuclease, partial [Sphingomonas sp.]|nr:restriction endonuclease [Sphingomonas sp.]